MTIDGEEFAPMEINLDSQQGANAWLTVGIREGRNREIRRAMAHVGLIVNRLIRIGYGPFKLTGMEENEVREVKRKVLRDQLGGLLTGETEEKPRSFRDRGAARADGKPGEGRARSDGPRRPMGKREDGDRARPAVRTESVALPPAVMTPGASPLASAPRGMTANPRHAVKVASPLVRLHATARGVNPLANLPVMERPANLLPKARAMANALRPVANPASSPVRPRARGCESARSG
ncbi:hypothetical protein ACFSS8_16955 [Paracoccus kondratievae]